MSDNTQKPWIRFYDDDYEDGIIGNKQGLIAFSDAIRELIEDNSDSFEFADFNIDADASILVCTDTEPSKEDTSKLADLTAKLLTALLVIWLTILPILGIIWLTQTLLN